MKKCNIQLNIQNKWLLGLVIFLLFFIPTKALAVVNAAARIDIYDQNGLESGKNDDGNPYSYKYAHEPYLLTDGRTDIGGYVGWSSWNGKPNCLAQGGCCLFAHAHAIEWLEGKHLGDSLLVDLINVCCSPSNNYGHNYAGCANHTGDSFNAYKDYALSRGIWANHWGGQNGGSVGIDWLRQGFCDGNVYIVSIPGHYVCAVDYVIADKNGYIIQDDGTTPVPDGGAFYVQIVDSAPDASSQEGTGRFAGSIYELTADNKLVEHPNRYDKHFGASYFVKTNSLKICTELVKKETWPGHLAAASTSGTCGDDLSWEVDGSTLVITGSGAMKDYGIYGSPWYYHRNNITSVQLPAGLTKIGAHAFQDFVITNIDIPQSVTEIGEAAFERCYNLPTVTLPDNLKIIGSWVFRLSGITQIDLPYTLESLGTHAFAETAITEITLPASLTEIDGNPFNGLTGLTIKGYADTAAQTFANNNGFTFVLLNPVAVTGVSMSSGNQLTIAEYDQYQLTALISPANATYKNIIWSSSNPNFAEVDQNGLVTGKEPGSTATITAVSESNPDVWASVTVRVTYHTHISEWVTVQAPTYQSEGLRECRCTLCGDLLDEEVLPRLHIALQEGSTWPGDANNRTGYPTGNLQQGKGFGLRGVVIASENLVKVTGYVYSANGENALPPAEEELNAPSLDIEHSKINNELIFSNLGNGTYRYTVVAQTVSGYTETVIDSLFSVGSAAVFTPANLPASFYAYVRHQSKQLYMTNQLNNIAGEPYTGALNQVWRFERQSSGAYAIFSELNGTCVDVEGFSTENGANVYAYTGGFNNTTNQLFYIYYMYDAYYLCPAHVNGASMVDMSLATNDFAIWTRGDNWEPQEFDIIQVKSVVQFNANGGRGAPSRIRRGYNESVMLPSRQPARLGYEFVGWAETPDADSAAYLPGDQYAEKGDAVLYALWSPVTIVRLPSGLTTLEEEAFANTQVVSVICPDGMTSIGPRAFANCTSLKQIYIPESVVTIDDTAFEGCTQTIEIWGVMDSNATQFVDGHSGFRFVEAD